METAKYLAIKTLLDNGINSLPLLSHNVEEMITKQGFKIISYNIPLSKEDKRDFEKLSILHIALEYKAFTYLSEDKRFVFYRSDLSAQQRCRLLAHELGHITLRHFALFGVRCSSMLNTPQERESEAFALELLAPACILRMIHNLTPAKISHITLTNAKDAQRIFLRIQKHTNNTDIEDKLCNAFKSRKRTYYKYFIFAFVVLIVILSVMGMQDFISTTDTLLVPTASPYEAIYIEKQNDIIVFTKWGTKYHKPDCYHIKNRTTFETTAEEAIKQGLMPCADCF